MIVLYSDNTHIDMCCISKLFAASEYRLCHSIIEFENATADLKIAFTACRYDCEFDRDAFNTVEERIEYLHRVSNLVFVFDFNFYIDEYQPIWDKLPYKNIHWVVPGVLTDKNSQQHIIPWMGWFLGVAGVYRLLPELLEKINSATPKPLYFDALLGRPREHRDYLYNAITNSQYRDKIVTTYLKAHDQMQEFLQNEFVWDRDCLPVSTLNGMQDQVMYHGHSVGLYSIIPIDLYNQTAYSIIAETNIDNRITFFTEKIAKPIVGRRLFVVFTGWKFLEELRNLGFKTFDGVIDESYDQIENSTERYAAAFEQVERLCTINQQEIYSKIRDITDHNYNLMMNTNWDQTMANQLQKIINDNSTI